MILRIVIRADPHGSQLQLKWSQSNSGPSTERTFHPPQLDNRRLSVCRGEMYTVDHDTKANISQYKHKNIRQSVSLGINDYQQQIKSLLWKNCDGWLCFFFLENREEGLKIINCMSTVNKHTQSTSVHMTDSLHCAQDFTKLTPKSYKPKIQIKIFWDSCEASLLKKSPNIVNKSLGSHLLSRQTWAGRDEASEAERGRWRFRGMTEKRKKEIEKSDAWRQRRKWLCAQVKHFICWCVFTLNQFACSSVPTLHYLWEKLNGAGVWIADGID